MLSTFYFLALILERPFCDRNVAPLKELREIIEVCPVVNYNFVDIKSSLLDWNIVTEDVIVGTLRKLYHDKRLDGLALRYNFLSYHRDYVESTIELLSFCSDYTPSQLKFMNIKKYNDLIIKKSLYIGINSSLIKLSIIFLWFLFTVHHNKYICNLMSNKLSQQCEHQDKCTFLAPDWIQRPGDENDAMKKLMLTLCPTNNWDQNLNSIISEYLIGDYMCFHNNMKLYINEELKVVDKFKNGKHPKVRVGSKTYKIIHSKNIRVDQCRCMINYSSVAIGVLSCYIIVDYI